MPSATNDGRRSPDFSVGVSDKFILVVSLGGFVALAALLYGIVMVRLKTADELDIEDPNIDYNDRLMRADVSKLSRAERRARARHIMKQQRRAGSSNNNNNNNNNNGMLEGENHNEDPVAGGAELDNENDDDTTNDQHQVMSRRERQKAAKVAEKEERMLYDEERQKEQMKAQREAQELKQERERQEAERLRLEKLHRKEREQEQELEDYEEWKSFVNDDFSMNSFVGRCQNERTIDTEGLSKELNIPVEPIHGRIQELLDARRISGMLDTSAGKFLYLSQAELSSIASNLQQLKTISFANVLTEVEKQTAS